MNRQRTIALQRLQMLGCRIALVGIESILRVPLVQPHHFRIARDLRDDRGSRDAGYRGIAANHGLALTGQDRTTVAVNQCSCGLHGQRGYGALHRQKARLEDIDAIDFIDLGTPDRPGDRVLLDLDKQAFAPSRREFLGIRQTLYGVACIQNDSRRDDRPGQRPASHLVHAADQPLRQDHARSVSR